jgi:hypothetical protein
LEPSPAAKPVPIHRVEATSAIPAVTVVLSSFLFMIRSNPYVVIFYSINRNRLCLPKISIFFTSIPSFAVVDKASKHDSSKAENICVNLKKGDILLAEETGRFLKAAVFKGF